MNTIISQIRTELKKQRDEKTRGTLLTDTDDMMQKGYGWMLKAASQKNEKEVFNYVMRHKKTMPRTALRYAIEKMPQNLKQKAMVK